ncbi:MAG: FbpB family small basic protein [Bacillus sp. (in: firmicutes)]
MNKRRKRSFEDLVLENKNELLRDRKEIERIERKLEQKRLEKAE